MNIRSIVIKTFPLILLASGSYSYSMEWARKNLQNAWAKTANIAYAVKEATLINHPRITAAAALATPVVIAGMYIVRNAAAKNVLPTFEEYTEQRLKESKESKRQTLRSSAERKLAQSDSAVAASSGTAAVAPQMSAVQKAKEELVFVDASDSVSVVGNSIANASDGITVIENIEGISPLHEAIRARNIEKIYQILGDVKTFIEMENLLFRAYKNGQSAMVYTIELGHLDILQILHRYYVKDLK